MIRFLHIAESVHEPSLKFGLEFQNSETYSKDNGVDYYYFFLNSHAFCKMNRFFFREWILARWISKLAER